MTLHNLPDWVTEGLRNLSVERELPKWPVLLVSGERVDPRLGREICLRTSQPWAFTSSDDEEWRETLASAYGFTWDDDGWLGIEELDRLHRELRILELEFLGNDRVTATRFGLPSGWCDWDGAIGTTGTYLDSKWPTLADLNHEWARIAREWPKLRMTAQLATYKDPEEVGALFPFLTWDIEDGAVRLRRDPSGLLCAVDMPGMEDGFQEGAERGCSEETLRLAISEAKEERS